MIRHSEELLEDGPVFRVRMGESAGREEGEWELSIYHTQDRGIPNVRVNLYNGSKLVLYDNYLEIRQSYGVLVNVDLRAMYHAMIRQILFEPLTADAGAFNRSAIAVVNVMQRMCAEHVKAGCLRAQGLARRR